MIKYTLLFLTALSFFLAPSSCVAEEPPQIVTTLNEDGSTNTWTQADLVAALQLLNRKYHREVATPSGRQAWHGKTVREEVDLDRAVKLETHEDGMIFEIPFSAPKKATPKTTLDESGVPPALTAARERRKQEKATTNIVTVVTTAQ